MNFLPTAIRIVDVHTAGAVTRLVVSGGPTLSNATMTARLAEFQGQHDHWRRALTGAPRSAPGSIAALLTDPERPASLAGVLLFDADGVLAPSAEAWRTALVGVTAALAHLGRLRPGPVQLDTATGAVNAVFQLDGSVQLDGADGAATALRAHVMFDGTMVVEADDPLGWGQPLA